MKQYQHVEDFIEIIGGWRNAETGKLVSFWDSKDPYVNLARYDVRIIESFCNQVSTQSIAFTDKQGELAKNLVIKYTKQLSKKGVEVPEQLTFRMPIRVVNRQMRAWADDKGIYLQFPFTKDWIESIKKSAKESQGTILWNRDITKWQLDLTEYNVNWAYAFCTSHPGFEIDSTLQSLMDQITECEQTNYAIELTVNEDGLTITNAEDSLKEYIEAHGGFTDDNLLRLVDMSGTLSYTVSPIIQETVAEAYGPRFLSLCINRELKIDATNIQGQVSQLIKYAEATQRYPICIYEPDLSGALLSLFKPHFKEEELLIVGNRMELVNFDTNVKVVYTHKIPRKWTNSIPLLISGAGMMFGGDRQIWLQSAEKVVYFAKDIYTKSSKGKEICRLD